MKIYRFEVRKYLMDEVYEISVCEVEAFSIQEAHDKVRRFTTHRFEYIGDHLE